jgi:hypothetical protein
VNETPSKGFAQCRAEAAQCPQVRFRFLQVGQVAAVFEHHEHGTRDQAVVPGGLLGPG